MVSCSPPTNHRAFVLTRICVSKPLTNKRLHSGLPNQGGQGLHMYFLQKPLRTYCAIQCGLLRCDVFRGTGGYQYKQKGDMACWPCMSEEGVQLMHTVHRNLCAMLRVLQYGSPAVYCSAHCCLPVPLAWVMMTPDQVSRYQH